MASTCAPGSCQIRPPGPWSSTFTATAATCRYGCRSSRDCSVRASRSPPSTTVATAPARGGRASEASTATSTPRSNGPRRLVRPGLPVLYWGRSLGTTMAAYAATRRRPAGLVLEAGFPDVRTLMRATPPLGVCHCSRRTGFRRPSTRGTRRLSRAGHARRCRRGGAILQRPRAVRSTARTEAVCRHRRRRSQRCLPARSAKLLERRARLCGLVAIARQQTVTHLATADVRSLFQGVTGS